jgi:hypothetical protein
MGLVARKKAVADTSTDPAATAIAGVPMMVINAMRSRLVERGYCTSGINKMTPRDAWHILNGDESDE